MEKTTYSFCPCCESAAIVPKLSARDYTVSGELFPIWECTVCTARFTQDVPAESSIGRYYRSENYISHSDTRKGLINSLYHVVRRRTLRGKKHLIETAAGLRNGDLLDIGAGTGAFAAFMAGSGWKVEGLEPDDETRRLAFTLHGVNLSDAASLFDLPAGSFDVITMWHVLEHVHRLHEYLDQIRKLLRKQGKAFIAVPNYTSADANHYREFWAAYDVPRHLYHFSPLSMKLILQRHGLHLQRQEPMWYDSFYVSLLSEQYKRGSTSYLQALASGVASTARTMADKERSSSLIYIIGAAH